MRLKTLESLARSESRSHYFLAQKSWQRKRRVCVRCGGVKLYHLAGKRYRCARCGYTFHDFTGRWVGALNLRPSQWLWILKLFELDIGPQRTASEVGLSYPTALKAMHMIRCALFADFTDSQIADAEPSLRSVLMESVRDNDVESSRRGPRLALGVSDRGGTAAIAAVPDITPQRLIESGVPVVKRGAALYSDRYADFDAIIFSGAWSQTQFRAGRSRIYSDNAEGFWVFLHNRLKSFHGVSVRRFPFYLVEIKFRYNHRGHQLVEMLADFVTRLMPHSLQEDEAEFRRSSWRSRERSLPRAGQRVEG
jgi:transposase